MNENNANPVLHHSAANLAAAYGIPQHFINRIPKLLDACTSQGFLPANIYLARPITHASTSKDAKWIKELKRKYKVFDPRGKRESKFTNSKTFSKLDIMDRAHMIFMLDILLISKCSAVVCDASDRSWGTATELNIAKLLGIPAWAVVTPTQYKAESSLFLHSLAEIVDSKHVTDKVHISTFEESSDVLLPSSTRSTGN